MNKKLNMSKLVIVRHGQSLWNLENKFTGWVDVDLTDKGVIEAKNAAKLLKGYHFDSAFSSVLKRANRTLYLILEGIDQDDLPVIRDKALNERMYGDLQGMDKDETRKKYGDEQVLIWRRSFDTRPPGGESLKDTLERVIPYFDEHIAPLLREGENVIVAAHGNSLRALIMRLENLNPEQILEVEIPTGAPKEYILDENLNVVSSKFL